MNQRARTNDSYSFGMRIRVSMIWDIGGGVDLEGPKFEIRLKRKQIDEGKNIGPV